MAVRGHSTPDVLLTLGTLEILGALYKIIKITMDVSRRTLFGTFLTEKQGYLANLCGKNGLFSLRLSYQKFVYQKHAF